MNGTGSGLITYNFEYERKLRVGFIGAGGHSYRNVYPTFQYAPVELVAVCDVNKDRAAVYAKQFGAERSYSDYREMLDKETLDAVFIVTAYEPDGRVQATAIAREALRAGVHVWMEKPTAASTKEIAELMALSRAAQRYVMTGTKKIFFPSVEKVHEIIHAPEFGRPASFYLRYPMTMPELERRQDLRQVEDLLDHIFHPASILYYLFGKIERFSYDWEPVNGGSALAVRFVSGVAGAVHFAAGIAGSSPLERLEVVGEGCNVVVENGVKVTYYRKAARPAYGRAASYLVPDEAAPLYWEPEFSLGQLMNKNIFYLGYVQEVLHFCESVLEGRAPVKGGLEASLEILKLFEALRTLPPGHAAVLNA
ncbi:gfo/Idh/MocA family oxidoreductase [Cohnella sp. CFH 77786]|uniref:Gfo/Idh/MocA family protein n=1 Tax=Cohnella sp. CFH 77786 TaxID=2662265 RepID=UPI001C60BF51|nr:Gfo/Idh/MocA family oxidoreductase [Cohnella sp. CFH 77786]MBW5444808.1 gfo/Idh/MocA family oxidoreductase [Cohnella sp. CFH 77786]